MKLLNLASIALIMISVLLSSCGDDELEASQPTVSMSHIVDTTGSVANVSYFVSGQADHFTVISRNLSNPRALLIRIGGITSGDTVLQEYRIPGEYESYVLASTVGKYGEDIKRAESERVTFEIR